MPTNVEGRDHEAGMLRWALTCLAAGASLAGAGLLMAGRESLYNFEIQSFRLAAGAGAALFATGLLALLPWSRSFVGRRLRDGGEPVTGVDGRWLNLVLVSFVALFMEVALIRYTGSQLRVFAFYKNVPLIGAFLGLGLGCWQGRGGERQALGFLGWLLPFSTLLSASPAILGRQLARSITLGSSEHVLGDNTVGEVSSGAAVAGQLVMVVVCVTVLVAVTLLFVRLGRLLGAAFDGLPRLQAYSANIAGSLLGVLCFSALSRAETSPWVWFLVGTVPLLRWVRPGPRLFAASLIVLNVLAVWPSVGDTSWSRYQKLVGETVQPFGPGAGSPLAYEVQISDVFYQIAIDQRPETVARHGDLFPHYNGIYRAVPKPESVLVVGSGMGNDVAAAIRAGAIRVDAVEIDPAIVRLGRLHHPERPYDDPRVRVIVDDARAVLRTAAAGSYDLVVFGLLDSHTQLGQSSLRLDNYVFTRESFQAARRIVRPGGHVVVTAAALRPWFVDRMRLLLAETVNPDVLVVPSGSWWTFVAEVGPLAPPPGASRPDTVVLPDDNWPFLYLPGRTVPAAYLAAVLVLALVSVFTLRTGGLRLRQFDRFHAHLFFLGAGFLLMEVHAVNRLALLFGTTWTVSAAAIVIVLSLILAANLTFALVPGMPPLLVLGGLFGALAASYFVNPAAVLGGGLVLSLLYGFVLLSPVYFAGIIFARSFSRTADPGSALGANILGAVLGGWLEYASMAYGMRALVLLAGAFYLLSALLLRSAEREGTAARQKP